MATSTNSTAPKPAPQRAALPASKLYINLGGISTFSVACCGMQGLHGSFAYKEEFFYKNDLSPYYESRRVPFTLREAYEALDKQLPDLIRRNYGQFILTDRIVGYEADVMYTKQTDLDTEISNFTVKDFVKYLIARKVGTVIRGPITHNPSYGECHAICAWIWVPDDKFLLDPLSETLVEGVVSEQNEKIAGKFKLQEILADERAMMDVQWPPVEQQSTTLSSKA